MSIRHIALPVVMSICGKIFNQDFKQVTTPYRYTMAFAFPRFASIIYRWFFV
ncbi:Uncharacterized protein FWK35_00027337 [Aphis craccivora]|uniref:Uncharacterized protein n=1 Tax=Aphis craccivora TaxID=307492 RepID=A0A6G0W2Q8_APHCR|nr:Uncharacterized protein FWK35_00027337 [Aphis craccivora]